MKFGLFHIVQWHESRTPRQALDEALEQIRELGINRVFGSFGFPGLAREKAIRSMEMFASEVMPRFRQVAAEAPGD